MRGLASLLPVKYKFKQLYPVARSWGLVATSTPKEQNINDSREEGRISNENAESIVAFSRPPPPPPILGPLGAISLVETWSSNDGDDD